MQLSGKLLAGIAPHGDTAFLAAVVDPEAAPAAAAAKVLCASRDDARQWIEEQAEARGQPLLWVSEGVLGLMVSDTAKSIR
jgi:hypothetical protein